MQTDRESDTYVIMSISFREKPAGNIATMSLCKTAELEKDNYPVATAIIINNTDVDDIVDSVRSYVDANRVTGKIDQLIKPRGFEIKE